MQRDLDDLMTIRGLDCPEVNPVPVAYQRMNGSWVCAAGYAGSVQAVLTAAQ